MNKEDARQKMDDVLKKWHALDAALCVLYADGYMRVHGTARLMEEIQRMTQFVYTGLLRLIATLKLPPPV